MTKNKVSINTGNRKKLQNAVFYEDAELNLSSVKKILGVSAVAKISNYEAMKGEIRVAGKIPMKIIYLSDEDQILSYDYSKEFMATLSNADIMPNDKAVLRCAIIDTDYSGTQELKIKLSLSIDGYYIKEMPVEILEVEGEGIHCKKDQIKLDKIINLNETTLEISKSFEAKENIFKILAYNTNCVINNIYPYDELFQVEGEAVTNIIALGEDNKLISQSFNQDFALEAPHSDIMPSSEIMLECFNKSTTIILEEEGSRNIIIDLEISFKGVAVEKSQTEVICDAYCIDKELIVKDSRIDVNEGVWQRNKKEEINGSFQVDDDIEKVVAVINPVNATIELSNNFGLYAEGMVYAQVVYINKENIHKSVKCEIPYQILIDKDIMADDNSAAQIMINNCQPKKKTANEIELNMNAFVRAWGNNVNKKTIVEDMEEGAAKEDDNIAISLYIAKEGESLWDVAKMLSTDEKTLMQLNPDIKLPLRSGDKILLYREFSF
ncbi:MAG: DUF3794 and LysM peptidoglycan-binding domain-containing protein [Christensenellales bacterium]|jgi:hypothetical protein|nr:LysM peptidoglycan-binding domain-containing protein [Clostridiales bacterium]